MKEAFNPKVSIIIPVYNGANFMRYAIDSALAQTYKNIEVLVINDGSNDGGETERIAKSYGNKIRYFCKENGGVATALNLGIEKMEGEYFSWLSHDDMYKPKKIENQINILKHENNKRKIVSGCLNIVDKNGNYMYKIDCFEQYNEKQLKHGLFSLMRGCINGCCLLIPRIFFERTGLFDKALLTTQDFDMFYRLFKNYKEIVFCHTFDVLSRCHEDQGSKKYLSMHIKECDQLWIKMLTDLSEDEMIELDGDVYNFLNNTKKFLINNTMYSKAIEYLDRKIVEYLVLSKNEMYIYDFLHSKDISDYAVDEFLAKLKNINYNINIAFLLGDINDRGGLNKITIKIANLLSNKFNVIILTTKTNINGYTVSKKIRQILISEEIAKNHKIYAIALTLLNAKVVICGYNCNSNYLSLYKELKKYNIKTIAWNHEFYFVPYYNTTLNGSIIGRNIKLGYADKVIWLNKLSYNLYSIFKNNAIYLPNSINAELIKTKKNRSQKLISVGRFDDERKGLTELLQVFSLIVKKKTDIELHIFGKYNLDIIAPRVSDNLTYKEYMTLLNIPLNKIFFHGEVDNINEQYEKFDLHLMTSYNEGFGLVILEAAANGVPTIAFSGSAAEDIISEGVDGFTVDYGDIESMANKILDIMDYNDSKYYNLSINANKLAVSNNINLAIEKWELLINDLLKNNYVPISEYQKKGMVYTPEYNKKTIAQICNNYEESIKRIIEKDNQSVTYITIKQERKISIKNIKKIIGFYQKNGLRLTCKKIMEKLKE